ncbi:hypothetical protein B0H11DRAFT_1996243, partial [Mycena galericulata]
MPVENLLVRTLSNFRGLRRLASRSPTLSNATRCRLRTCSWVLYQTSVARVASMGVGGAQDGCHRRPIDDTGRGTRAVLCACAIPRPHPPDGAHPTAVAELVHVSGRDFALPPRFPQRHIAYCSTSTLPVCRRPRCVPRMSTYGGNPDDTQAQHTAEPRALCAATLA